MSVDAVVLRNEIETDPDGLGYATLSGPARVNLMNTPGNLLSPAKTGTGWTKAQPLVPVGQVAQWAATPDGSTGGTPIDLVTTASTNGALSSAVRGAALMALRLFAGAFDSFDVSSASDLAILGELVAAGLITPAQESSLVALGVVPCSRAEALFGAGTVLFYSDVAAFV